MGGFSLDIHTSYWIQIAKDRDFTMMLADIVGPKAPEVVGALLSDVVKKIKDCKDITDKNRWQVLGYLASDWLAK